MQYDEELLLRAALLKDERALSAWEAWHKVVDIQTIEYGSQRMLPLLYKNLQEYKIEDADMAICKGVYRQTWYKNQLAFHQLANLLKKFRENNIKTLVLKGAALIALYYKDHGLRPMSDFDILVPFDQRKAALTLLNSLNWQPMLYAPHSQGFKQGNFECDLHWYVMAENCSREADEDFWQKAITVQIKDETVFTLNATDQLLNICVHGIWWNYVSPLRWVADALIILENSDEIDWQRLFEHAKRRRLILPLKNGLNYLKETFDAPIPAEILKDFDREKISWSEQYDYQTKTCATKERTPLQSLWVCYREYQQLAQGDNRLITPIGFLKFLQSRWKADNFSQVITRSFKEIKQRI